MPNRLAQETSPYLLQHADNPVEWFPWGEEAFAKAQEEGKPIFLSIGYSACHWCHVMAHESFEDDDTAAFMNENFINVKVDREERPDVDGIYMSAVQAISGGGGWPMSVWMLPDGRPFFGGTYFPKEARYGMRSFMDLLRVIVQNYRENREALENDAARLTEAISGQLTLTGNLSQDLSLSILDEAFQKLASEFDATWGGLGSAPKFPPSMALDLLLRLYARHGWDHALHIVTHTLDKMAAGGMYDHLGGGFSRYSVDNKWLIPHFEKMLYDNALLLRIYAQGYLVAGKEHYLEVINQTVAYLKREMTAPGGAFYSAQDADSEGEEGKFFRWTEDELRQSLDGHIQHVESVLDYWGVLDGPNFEGEYHVLWTPLPLEDIAAKHKVGTTTLQTEIAAARSILFDIRDKRVYPGLDDKVLTAWNGLMISTLAQVGRMLDRSDLIEMASNAGRFIIDNLLVEGRLRRSFKQGQAKFNAYLEDYAFLAEGLLELYQATFDLSWYRAAVQLTEQLIDLFWEDGVGFFDTSHDHEQLIKRPQDVTDNATPSGTSVAVGVLLRLAILADRPDWHDKARQVLARLSVGIQQYPRAFAYLAQQLDFALGKPHEIALVGDPADESMQSLLKVVNQAYRPNQLIALAKPGGEAQDTIALLAGRDQIDGKPTAFVCYNFACRLPVTGADALAEQLSSHPA
ncbi:MAG: thioredoxin domain-containing protein [Chloroflexi bacterium]|nr:thioredoxin domain-containing protein [Chloroflexota bacterium]